MELIVKKTDLLNVKRQISTIKLPKKKKLIANVILSAENNEFSIALTGYEVKIRARIIKSGSFTLPFFIWENLILNINNIPNSEIIIAVEENIIMLDKFTIKNQHIKSTTYKKAILEIPLNAGPGEVLSTVFNNYEQYENAGLNIRVKNILSRLRKQLWQASSILKEYKITPADIAQIIAEKLALNEKDKFLDLLFENSSERKI